MNVILRRKTSGIGEFPGAVKIVCFEAKQSHAKIFNKEETMMTVTMYLSIK